VRPLRASTAASGDAQYCAWLGQQAVLALYDELALAPKPGLVSFVDSGSHRDMDGRTFMRSLFALRHAFPALARFGGEGAPFAALRELGVLAEARMLLATGGINTHRGAIFSLGMLCAAAGRCGASSQPIPADVIRATLLETWGDSLAGHAAAPRSSHGASAARAHGLRDVATEAALGFPTLFEIVWPSLRAARAQGLPPARARLQALFAAMAALDDTNLAHRGGLAGLRYVQERAGKFLARGGAARDDAEDWAWRFHRELVALHLSPGGSADLLASACWLQRVTD
jgi:triphosphoribosyl-dephospho-CoA synthase